MAVAGIPPDLISETELKTGNMLLAQDIVGEIQQLEPALEAVFLALNRIHSGGSGKHLPSFKAEELSRVLLRRATAPRKLPLIHRYRKRQIGGTQNLPMLHRHGAVPIIDHIRGINAVFFQPGRD